MRRLVAVATSGGRDSTALLHATCRAAADLDVDVVALHVHHGLMPEADAWVAQLQRQCRRWARSGLPVRLRIQRLKTSPGRGDSVEAWARRERYRALAAMALEEGAGIVLLAHHRRDQAETFLLQALRGAGPAGLSAMPRVVERAGIRWRRPWLEMPRSAIEAYVRRYGLSHVDDTSNADPRFARGRMRQVVWPALEQAFPDVETVLCHAASRAQEAACCLQELAKADLAAGAADEKRLPLPGWLRLSPARRANTLRHWLKRTLSQGVPDTLILRLLDELPGARSGAAWPTANGLLRLHRGALQWAPVPQPTPDQAPSGIIDLSRAGEYPLPTWGGKLLVDAVTRGGLDVRALQRAELRPRTGGERFQRAPYAHPRSLKKAYQEMGLGIDHRSGPLVYLGGRLAFVPGLGVDARQQVPDGEAGCRITWFPGD